MLARLGAEVRVRPRRMGRRKETAPSDQTKNYPQPVKHLNPLAPMAMRSLEINAA